MVGRAWLPGCLGGGGGDGDGGDGRGEGDGDGGCGAGGGSEGGEGHSGRGRSWSSSSSRQAKTHSLDKVQRIFIMCLVHQCYGTLNYTFPKLSTTMGIQISYCMYSTPTHTHRHTCAILLMEMFLEGDVEVAPEERGRQGEVWVPADAILTTNFSGDAGSRNLPGLPPPLDFAGEATPMSCWLMLLCCCWRKSRSGVIVTPLAAAAEPPLAAEEEDEGLGAMGTGLVGVPLEPPCLMEEEEVVFLEVLPPPPGEKSWRRVAEPGDTRCSLSREAIGEESPVEGRDRTHNTHTRNYIHIQTIHSCSKNTQWNL